MKKLAIVLFLGLFLYSCSEDFLDENPVGELSPSQITVEENLEGVVISAYSILNGQMDEASSAYNSPASNWSFGDVTSDDAYKGGGGTGDQNQIHIMEIFQTNPANVKDLERKWLALYEGVKRANLALQIISESEEISTDLKSQRTAEMRFLRGHFYFELKKIFNQIPYIDETATKVEDYYVSNTALSNEQLWGKIEEDFQAAYNVLPMDQAQPGRPTKMAAQAYLAKTYIYQQKWSQAAAAADDVINSGKYSLMADFTELWLSENDNGPEIIFAIQNSINDGSPLNYNGSIGDRLAPPGGPYPQYGFHRPTQNLVNSFKTDENGLPVLDNVNPADGQSFDTRIDHTIGRPGIPFLDLGVEYQESWARDLATYGPYGPKKRIVSWSGGDMINTWPYVNSLNTYVIRYADLLLWRAEAAIETGDLNTGLQYVNMVRERAMNTQTVKTLDGSADADNYSIGLYTSFSNYDQAITALRTERRLELALEGQRFFDLVRWGIAAEVMNDYFSVERTRRTHLSNANFTAGKNEYMPIPQSQMDLGRGMFTQNPGY